MSKYEISFINHSSLLVSDDNTKILTDPWFISPALENGINIHLLTMRMLKKL